MVAGEAPFDYPDGVAISPDGIVYVAGDGVHLVQVFGASYPSTWHGEFFANRWLAEAPVLIQNYSTLNSNGMVARPVPGAGRELLRRFQRTAWFESGAYRFTLMTDDAGVGCGWTTGC